MKILIFENEVEEVKEAFDDVNFLDFNNTLNYTWVKKSQDFKDFNTLPNFNVVIIDIDLSPSSEKDGYGIISELINTYNYNNIIVMTGHEVEEELIKKGYNNIKILKKPLMLDEIHSKLKSFKKK